MKIHNLLYLGFSLLLLASCASDNDVASGDNGGKTEYDGVTASVASKQFEVASRSSLNFDPSYGMQFRWNKGDQLTILPKVDGNTTYGVYTIKDEDANKAVAHFECNVFSLSPSARYFAFSKKERETPALISIPDKANIKVDYSGQRQVESGTAADNTKHLGDYDFMAATATCSPNAEDNAYFDFKHLGFTMYIKMAGLPMNGKYKRLEIYDSKNVYRKPIRTINLNNGFDESAGTYTPAFDVENIQSEEYKKADRFSLLLGENDAEGMEVTESDGKTYSDGVNRGKLDLFIELPPVDMRDNTFIFTLVPANSDTKPYYMKCEDRADKVFRKEYKAGWAYIMDGTAEEVTTYEVSLKVNHDWQLGNAVSRATTGDPGNMDKYEKPKYIYYVFCVGGNVKQLPSSSYWKKVTVANPEKDWTESNDKVFDTYKDNFTFSVEDTEKDATKNVYFVASMEELDGIFNTTNINSGTKEDAIQALLYNIPAKTSAETDDEYQTRSQSFLKNLYSTPWESQSTFIGALKDPYQDVILYHVAAKVDLKWNSSVMLPITGDDAFVKVNNVKNSGLSLFQPTTNVYASGSYNVSAPIEEDTWLNGRQVFYLPQFANPNCTYNVKIGDKTAENATFSPATTNGFTSWLRWLANFK